jgi:hypothetical protein
MNRRYRNAAEWIASFVIISIFVVIAALNVWIGEWLFPTHQIGRWLFTTLLLLIQAAAAVAAYSIYIRPPKVTKP